MRAAIPQNILHAFGRAVIGLFHGIGRAVLNSNMLMFINILVVSGTFIKINSSCKTNKIVFLATKNIINQKSNQRSTMPFQPTWRGKLNELISNKNASHVLFAQDVDSKGAKCFTPFPYPYFVLDYTIYEHFQYAK